MIQELEVVFPLTSTSGGTPTLPFLKGLKSTTNHDDSENTLGMKGNVEPYSGSLRRKSFFGGYQSKSSIKGRTLVRVRNRCEEYSWLGIRPLNNYLEQV